MGRQETRPRRMKPSRGDQGGRRRPAASRGFADQTGFEDDDRSQGRTFATRRSGGMLDPSGEMGEAAGLGVYGLHDLVAGLIEEDRFPGPVRPPFLMSVIDGREVAGRGVISVQMAVAAERMPVGVDPDGRVTLQRARLQHPPQFEDRRN